MPNSSNHSLYLIKRHTSSYPVANFRGNQRRHGSMSLSPLYPSITNDLHASIAMSLHQSPLALPCSGIVHHRSGLNSDSQTQTCFSELVGCWCKYTSEYVIMQSGYKNHKLQRRLDSLFRFSRRVQHNNGLSTLFLSKNACCSIAGTH